MIFRIAASAALALTAVLACAQSYPVKPIRIVIGFPPGGGIDIVGRLLAPKLSESLGQQVVVDNRAGANGIIAAELVAKTAPDGYTIFFGTTGNLSVNPALYSTLPFSIERDFILRCQHAPSANSSRSRKRTRAG
jgi:tripartite-type tricarboxylate transporter receptor subunit TctC